MLFQKNLLPIAVFTLSLMSNTAKSTSLDLPTEIIQPATTVPSGVVVHPAEVGHRLAKKASKKKKKNNSNKESKTSKKSTKPSESESSSHDSATDKSSKKGGKTKKQQSSVSSKSHKEKKSHDSHSSKSAKKKSSPSSNKPSSSPTLLPSTQPSLVPASESPTEGSTAVPTVEPTFVPTTATPTIGPTSGPTSGPTLSPMVSSSSPTFNDEATNSTILLDPVIQVTTASEPSSNGALIGGMIGLFIAVSGGGVVAYSYNKRKSSIATDLPGESSIVEDGIISEKDSLDEIVHDPESAFV